MSVCGEDMPSDVAPPDDFACRQSDKLRVAAFDVAQHKFADLRQRRRFEKREKFPLSRDRVEGAMKALDMVGRDGRYARVKRDVRLFWGRHASTIITG